MYNRKPWVGVYLVARNIRSTFLGSPGTSARRRSTLVGVFEVWNLVSTIDGAQNAYVLAWKQCLSVSRESILISSPRSNPRFHKSFPHSNVFHFSIKAQFSQYCIGVSCTIVHLELTFLGSPGTSARRLSVFLSYEHSFPYWNVLHLSIKAPHAQYCIGVSCTIVNLESAFTGSPGTSARRLSGRQEPPLDICRCIWNMEPRFHNWRRSECLCFSMNTSFVSKQGVNFYFEPPR